MAKKWINFPYAYKAYDYSAVSIKKIVGAPAPG